MPTTFKGAVPGGNVWLEAVTQSDLDDAVKYGKGLPGHTSFLVFRCRDESRIEVGSFSLAPMPGCCGVVVSCFSRLTDMTKHTGLSQPFRDLKQKVAVELGYSSMIATCDAANIPAAGSFLHTYRVVDSFINNRTNHLIWFGMKHLE